MIAHNKSLAEAAKEAGVETAQEYAIFQTRDIKDSMAVWVRRRYMNVKTSKKSKNSGSYGKYGVAANLFRANSGRMKSFVEKYKRKKQSI
jgi:DNA-damage-inducible protein D